MEKLSLRSKLNAIRLELSKEMTKSGVNDFNHYDYFQLKDFMPQAIELMNKHDVYTEFNMYNKKFELPGKEVTSCGYNENGEISNEITTKEENWEYREVATLDVYNLDDENDTIHLERSTADVNLSGAQPVQNLGGKSTYMKRYLYMDLFEINENDQIERETGKPEKVETKTTTASKPKTTSVSTKKETKKEEPKEEVTEEVSSEDLMSMPRKNELANYIKSKGGIPKDVMASVAATLGLEVPKIKESDYDNIKNEIDKVLGGE